jgi:hypothetical protein
MSCYLISGNNRFGITNLPISTEPLFVTFLSEKCWRKVSEAIGVFLMRYFKELFQFYEKMSRFNIWTSDK